MPTKEGPYHMRESDEDDPWTKQDKNVRACWEGGPGGRAGGRVGRPAPAGGRGLHGHGRHGSRLCPLRRKRQCRDPASSLPLPSYLSRSAPCSRGLFPSSLHQAAPGLPAIAVEAFGHPTPPPPRAAAQLSPRPQGPCLPLGLVREFRVVAIHSDPSRNIEGQLVLSAREVDQDVMWQRAGQIMDVCVEVGAWSPWRWALRFLGFLPDSGRHLNEVRGGQREALPASAMCR